MAELRTTKVRWLMTWKVNEEEGSEDYENMADI